MRSRSKLVALTIFSAIFLSACATQVAKPLDERIDENPTVQAALQNVGAYTGNRVRWGGVIAGVVNDKDTTVVEIVSRPLDKQGRPRDTDETYGRFLANVKGFLDPVVFAKGREFSVVGTITGQKAQLIDNYEYTYVEIAADNFKLWRPIEDRYEYYYDPYWYGPVYPWYRGWPYYHPRW